MRSVWPAQVLVACTLLASCGDSKDDDQPKQPALDFRQVDAVIEEFLREHELSGATAVVVQRERGQVHQRGYGEFEGDRLHLIASASKIISAGVLLALSDRGLLELDAPISEILAPFGAHKPGVTTAQCLSGSSGMLGLLEGISYGAYVCQYIESGSLQGCTRSLYVADDEDELIAPDTEFRYGGAQWQIAGGIAEIVSKKTWAELIQEIYVEPCDVPSLGYDNQFLRAQQGGEEFGYPEFFLERGPTRNVRNPNIEGGGYITSADYGKLLLMHLRGGMCGDQRVLSEEAVARMQEDRIASYGGSTGVEGMQGYGLGWWVDRDRPGLVYDPGLYGGRTWLDNERGYAAFIALEADERAGDALLDEVKPLLDAMFE